MMTPDENAYMVAYLGLITGPVLLTVGLAMLVELGMRATK